MANQVERVFYGGNQVAGQEVSREDLKPLKVKIGQWQQPDGNFSYDPLTGNTLYFGLLSFMYKGHHYKHYQPASPLNSNGTTVTLPYEPGVCEIAYTDAATEQATIWEKLQQAITDEEFPYLVKRTGAAPAYPGRVNLYPAGSDGLGTVFYFKSPIADDGTYLMLSITSSEATEKTVQVEACEIFTNVRSFTPPSTWNETGWDGAAIFQCIADKKNPILVLYNSLSGEKTTYTLQKKAAGTTGMVFAGNFTVTGFDKVSFAYDSGTQTWTSTRSTETYASGGSINYASLVDNDLMYVPSGTPPLPGALWIMPSNETVYVWDNTQTMSNSKFATACDENDDLVIEVPSVDKNFIVISLSSNLDIHSGSNSAVLNLRVQHTNSDNTVTFLTPVGNTITKLEACHAYRIEIVGDTYNCTLLNDSSFVTDEEFAAAIAALKSRIIYTIPLGAVDRIEKISMQSGTGEIRIHATLFNPNMDQDLNADSNVVLNFGPSYVYADHIFFAIYEYDSAHQNWKWIANTDEVNNNLNGIMHFPLVHKAASAFKLESKHLYLFCVCGNLASEVEIMGNELVDAIGMNWTSLALATAKQNAGTYNGAATFGHDFATLDLTTFSEAAANATIAPNHPVRVFAAITNLTGLP